MIALLFGLSLLAFFISFVLLFGTRPRPPGRWPDSLTVTPRPEAIDIFRDMLGHTETTAEQEAGAVRRPDGPSPE